MRSLLILLALLSSSVFAQSSRDYITIVGSSTVYPFSIVVAEAHGYNGFKTPTVESTGTGGGMRIFCGGIGLSTPDATNASRKIRESEVDLCHANGVSQILEVNIGYDGIVLANDQTGPDFSVTREQIFLALAKYVPVNGVLVENPYQNWNEVDPSLPNQAIEVYGPPPTSGTRDAFVELVMDYACEHFPEYSSDVECQSMREDGKFIEAGENDNMIVQKLRVNPLALGIFGYSFLQNNNDVVKGSVIDGYTPEFENIASGDYPISRPLYFYVKLDHVGLTPGLQEFVDEFTHEDTIGDFGYLTDIGLIPLLDISEVKTIL